MSLLGVYRLFRHRFVDAFVLVSAGVFLALQVWV